MTTQQAGQTAARRALARRGMAVAGRGSERALAAAAHGAIAFGFLGIGFLLALAITAIIWLASRKSPYVREQADRAGRYQLFVLAVNIGVVGLWVLGFALLLALTGWRIFGFGGGDPRVADSPPVTAVIALDSVALIAAIPLFIAWFYGTIAYGVYGTLRALAGHDFRYPPVPWARRTRRARSASATAGAGPEVGTPGGEVRDSILERTLKWER